jgi:hypothetical protein
MWREDENKESNTSIIAQKKGGPRRRPTKLEAAAINTMIDFCSLWCCQRGAGRLGTSMVLGEGEKPT